jgi:2-dehydro-3-deoxy-D-arabinonate dehydratase
MRLFQVRTSHGACRLGLSRAGRTAVLASAHDGIGSVLELLTAHDERRLSIEGWAEAAEREGRLTAADWDALVAGRAGSLTVPVTPPEVWGAGVTYRRSADFREEGTGIYDRVYDAERPELFFKATASRCSGPGEPIGRRRDSSFTAAEPELAVIVGASGRILGYTLANDVSAWDIERDNPLYLPQSKVYRRCFAFGPAIVTADEIADPYALTLRCAVRRAGREVFAGEASTGQLKRPLDEIVGYLLRSNEILTGTVLSTGTGIIQPLDVGLEEGDEVVISCPQLGELRNTVALV